MLHLVLCFSVWTLIFTWLSWRLFTIVKQGINHLQRLHQVPCSKCAYFTGDYRLKCTVNPTVAMSETAIGCRDFIYGNNRTFSCSNCTTTNQCGNSKKQEKYSLLKRKLTYLK
ncbi:MAG: hypothetical protein AAFW67_09670 [Cyanobacteria bacterium J06638_38]